MWYLNRLKGETTFGWSVTTFTPLVLAIIGFGPWMEWSNNIVSWELGISIISLTALAMWLSLRSNSGMIFAIVAVASGLIPILYETQNNPIDSSGAGGAMSLMVFVIIIQGWLAADDRLRQDLMQWTSALLVGEVLLAMILTRAEDLNLVLGFIRQDELGALSTVVTLQVVLWLTVLFAYFPATLKRRIPYMPIGLAASLFIITPEASLIPWIVTLVMLPYLLIVSKITRTWVANWSMIAAGFSFFVQSHLTGGFHYEYFDAVILLALLVTGEMGRHKGHLSDWAHFVALGLMVLSDSVLFGNDPYIPWAIVLYSVASSYMMMDKAEKSGERKDAFEASAAMFGSMLMAVILSFADRLEVPLPDSVMDALSGFNITLAIVGLTIYFVMRRFKEVELDIGVLVNWGNSKRKSMIPVFENATGAWIIPSPEEKEEESETKGWGVLGRVSLLGPMLLFTFAISAVSSTDLALGIHWILLMLVPIGIVVKEVMDEKEASSTGRMIATWIILIIALPVSFKLILAGTSTSKMLITGVILDVILLSGPIVVSTMLSKKGLNDDFLDERADQLTLLGLLCLALLDASGGLLFLTMYILVFIRSLKHRQNILLMVAPIFLIAYANRFAWEGAVVGLFFDMVDYTAYNPSEVTIFGMTRFSCIIMALTSLAILGKGVIDRRQGLEENQNETPMAVPAVWLALGMSGVLPEASWLLLFLTIVLSFYSWLSGRIQFIPWAPAFTFISCWFGFSLDSNFSHFNGSDLISHSLLGTGICSLIINRMADSQILYKWADEPEDLPDAMSSAFIITTVQGREKIIGTMRMMTLICLTLSWTALNGIGTIIGAVWATWDAFSRGQKYAILGMPLLHAFAVWNLMDQFDIGTDNSMDIIVGTVLMLDGILMTMIATNTSIAWGWSSFEWEDEIEYYSWIDRVGMLAVAYFLAGITWAIGEAELDSLLWTIWAIYLGGIAVQGFRDETETAWRRGVGSFGSIFSLFMLSLTIETDLYRYVIWMLLGIVAFGFGILYMNRMGEGSAVFATEDVKIYAAEEVVEEETIEIPEPITSETVEDLEEEEVESAEEEEQAEEVSAPVMPAPVTPAPVMPVSNIVNTQSGFDMILDPGIMAAISQSLTNTPHEGFRPIVSIMRNGNLKIDFVKI
jgi:hypothetical protein